MTIYEIQEEQENLLQEMIIIANDDTLEESARDELLVDMQQKLNISHGDKKEKILNIATFIKNLRSDINEIKEELKILQNKKKSRENKVSFLEWLLNENIEIGDVYESARAKISWRASTQLQIDEKTEETLPDDYKKYELKVLKNELKRDIKLGKISLDNARIITKQNLQIK
jgi:hypothetical protein